MNELKRMLKKLTEKTPFRQMLRVLRLAVRRVKKAGRIIRRFVMEHYADSVRKKAVIIPNKIAIMTNTDTYTCNPKYIYEELIRRQDDYQIVWLAGRGTSRTGYPYDARVVWIDTFKGIREMYSSKILIDNGIAFSNYYDKKEGQIHIQTMHGSLGIKRLDNAVLARNERGKRGQRIVWRESELTDYVITNSKFEEDVFHSVFWAKTPMVRLGHARTDVLFSQDEGVIRKIRKTLSEQYSIPEDKKLLLYAPTHRKGLTKEDLYLDYEAVCEALSERFGGEYVILLRLHSRTKNIRTKAAADAEGEQIVFDVSDYPDIQELMMVTDVGVTDYSSWIYDYVLTRRPGLIYAADMERYLKNTGLYYPFEETPFPLCRTSDEVIEAIRNFDMDRFKIRCEEFLEEKQSVDDGHSAERIADWIETLVPVNDNISAGGKQI